ncbi:trinucleotide repeat-containing gene 6C protein-like [Brienomyrus brachyistius]|uniref:trinucleotide repeat-containing gene 6C protein-like n=1 Tax=Brienomyrus brachyistius TaxID=42636 RepID=UPI0020B1C498|nr:trinucleotide repeat-containing gene 6C protein-like [Brienomyrus brachyistius]XP_048847793.1 trinucleotide repeat-containing gene 6C protein-like [Brienomyrus brachyistius]
MGRLDDAAKRKVVELREAGLSFRKIKAVLELENIKVSAQAIYLFLKEFQSKPPSEQAGGGGVMAAPVSVEANAIAGHSGGWTDQPMWTLVREAPRGSGYGPPVDSTSRVGTPQAVTGNPPRPSVAGGSSGTAVQSGREAGKDEEEIQIVSVTSLARGGPHRGLQASGMGVGLAAASPRRRVAMSPASNPTLAARKRLLDKALMHKTRIREALPQSDQQGASLYRKDPSCLLSSDVRKLTVMPQAPSFSLNSPRPPLVRSRFGGQPPAGVARRIFQQRAGVSVRSMHPPLQRDPSSCPAIRVVNPVPSPPSAQAAGMGAVRSQPGLQEPAMWSGLQEQVQTLAVELRSLGMAVRLLAEQQGRLEREQSQQTQVQRQILSTLQGIASRLAPGRQSHCSRTPPPPGPPTYNQVPFEPPLSSYAQCSPAHPKTCESDGLAQEALDAYKLAGLSPRGTNGFQACSSADSFPAGHTSTQSQAPVQMRTLTYTQGQTPTYSQSYVETQSPAPEGHFQSCGPPPRPSSSPGSPLPVSSHDPQLNIIKVETL